MAVDVRHLPWHYVLCRYVDKHTMMTSECEEKFDGACNFNWCIISIKPQNETLLFFLIQDENFNDLPVPTRQSWMNSRHISFPSSVVCVVFARGLYRWCCSVRWASNCSPSENNSSLARKHRYEWMNMSWNWILVSQMRTSSVFVGCFRQWLLLVLLLFSVDVINIDEIRNFARELHSTRNMYGS